MDIYLRMPIRTRAKSRVRPGLLLAAASAVVILGGSSPAQPVPIQEAYASVAARLIGEALVDPTGWNRLGVVGDHFPGRLSGSENLERAIEWIEARMREDGLENVHTEPVLVPVWRRGEESAEILEPAAHRLAMLGLGGSVGTPPEGITAPVLVVRTFEELEAAGEAVQGKIVLCNAPFTTYGETVPFRTQGAVRAARQGAVAHLVRSVGPRSMRTPHTGGMRYAEGVARIPSAAIALEDAELIQRMSDRGEEVIVRLRMGAETLPDVESANVVAELRGRETPEEVVVLGGHLDSWDVGAGVMDDAGGCVAAWEALRLVQKLGLRPRRTLRVVLWANEENGARGGKAYRDAHREELPRHVLAVESDSGVFRPLGFGFTGSPEARAILGEICGLLDGIEAGEVTTGGGGVDIGPIMREGVPGMGLRVDGSTYFDYHHTAADTLDKLSRADFGRCVAALAVATYVVADLEAPLPRAEPEPAE